ncbi:MAG TPA: hypothetical protein VKX28_12705 [Xanthobacteraceae bacterium]|nr:hypothetical protein [Xanthobacteraceae bacterium]
MRNGSSPERSYPARLRDEIDSGRTGEKVAFPDPAAAPLGTDEEAAGTPMTAHAGAIAHSAETSRRRAPQMRARRGHGWILSAALLVIAGLAVCGLLLFVKA